MSQKFIVETSARHVHLTDNDVEELFGVGYKLTQKRDLSQKGQFACEEVVTLKTDKNITLSNLLQSSKIYEKNGRRISRHGICATGCCTNSVGT